MLNEYFLSAIIITNNKRIALLKSKRNKRLQKLNEGDELNGWTLTDIQPAQVSLLKGTEIKLMDLEVKGFSQQTDAKRNMNNDETNVLKGVAPSTTQLKKD